ncbi:MAG: DUF4157 domain-containing protein [Bacteroidota bacterium]
MKATINNQHQQQKHVTNVQTKQDTRGQEVLEIPTTPLHFGFITDQPPILPTDHGVVQPKLRVNPPNDSYEQEADRMAKKVMSMPAGNLQKSDTTPHIKERSLAEQVSRLPLQAQRKCHQCEKEDEAHMVQAKHMTTARPRVLPSLNTRIMRSKHSGKAMDQRTGAFMADRFGSDFQNIRIHTDDNAVQMNRDIHARAFTVGQHIYFNSGQYQPHTESGRYLLAHELTHTLQQQASETNRTVIQRTPDPESLGRSIDPSSLALSELQQEIQLIQSWLSNHPDHPDRDLLSSALAQMLNERNSRNAPSSNGSSSTVPSTTNQSTPRRRRRRSRPQPVGESPFNRSIDPTTLDDQELPEEIQRLRTWLIEHNTDEEAYSEIQDTLSAMEHEMASRDENLMSIDEGVTPENQPDSLRQSLDTSMMTPEELQEETSAVQEWLLDNPNAEQQQTSDALNALGQLEQEISTRVRPPFLWGLDQNTNRIYLSITSPGTSSRALATYLFGSAAGMERFNTTFGNTSEFLPQGTNLVLPGATDPTAIADLRNALSSGQILRTEGIPESANSSETMGYRFTYNGEEVLLNQTQLDGLLNGLKVYIQRKAQSLKLQAESARDSIREHIANTNGVIRGISDLAAGQFVPGENTFYVPINGANRLLAALEGELTPEMISRNANMLRIVGQSVAHAQQVRDRYFRNTIAGAESTVTALEFVRDASFGVAIAIGAVVAAPLVAGAVAGAGVTGTTATVLTIGGTGTVVGTGAGVLRGGSAFTGELISGNSLEDAGNAGLREGQRGFREGFIAGAAGGASRVFAPAAGASAQVGQQLYRRVFAEATINGVAATTDALIQGRSAAEAVQIGLQSAALSVPGSVVGNSNSRLTRELLGPLTAAATTYTGAIANGASPQEAIAQATVAATSNVAMTRASHGSQLDTNMENRGRQFGERLRSRLNPTPDIEPTFLQRQRAFALRREASELEQRASAQEENAARIESSRPEGAARARAMAEELRTRATALRNESEEFASGRRSATEDFPTPEEIEAALESLDNVQPEMEMIQVPLNQSERSGDLPRIVRPLLQSQSGHRVVFRVEGGGSRDLVQIGPNGEIRLTQGSTIHLNFGSYERALEFLAMRGPGSRIIAFEVDESWVQSARSSAIPEHRTKALRGRQPRLVDVTYADDQLEIPSSMVGELQDFIIPNSGRVVLSQ